jgi:hypothetical protein
MQIRIRYNKHNGFLTFKANHINDERKKGQRAREVLESCKGEA